mgnify:CR=1 FL=1
MKPGSLVHVYRKPPTTTSKTCCGFGIYLGLGSRGNSKEKKWIEMLFRGRIATFTQGFWIFEVINESR